MKIALKYGLLITAVVVGWIVVVRFLMDVGPDSKANVIAPILFNVAAIVAILLAMKARKNELDGDLSFKEGLKTGMGVSLVYAISACLFFMIEFLVAGPKLLLSEAGPRVGPMWQVAAIAYAGLFFGSLFFGLIYSTVIAFFIARRLPRQSEGVDRRRREVRSGGEMVGRQGGRRGRRDGALRLPEREGPGIRIVARWRRRRLGRACRQRSGLVPDHPVCWIIAERRAPGSNGPVGFGRGNSAIIPRAYGPH